MGTYKMACGLVWVCLMVASVSQAVTREGLRAQIVEHTGISTTKADSLLSALLDETADVLAQGRYGRTDQVVTQVAKRVEMEESAVVEGLIPLLGSLREEVRTLREWKKEETTKDTTAITAARIAAVAERIEGSEEQLSKLLEVTIEMAEAALRDRKIFLVDGVISEAAKKAKLSTEEAREVVQAMVSGPEAIHRRVPFARAALAVQVTQDHSIQEGFSFYSDLRERTRRAAELSRLVATVVVEEFDSLEVFEKVGKKNGLSSPDYLLSVRIAKFALAGFGVGTVTWKGGLRAELVETGTGELLWSNSAEASRAMSADAVAGGNPSPLVWQAHIPTLFRKIAKQFAEDIMDTVKP